MIKKYSGRAEEPLECLQFDQGEDRWLCTLMLRQGYRVQYCALAFAKTYAPTGFAEFVRQYVTPGGGTSRLSEN